MAKARQYATNDSRWRKIRAGVLAREPLCRHCAEIGRTEPATDVDHIDGNAFNNARDNLCALCKSCHSRKTATENGGFGSASRKPKRIGCSPDGMPLDGGHWWRTGGDPDTHRG